MNPNDNELFLFADACVGELSDSFRDGVHLIEQAIREAYAQGTPQEREIAPYIQVKLDTAKLRVIVYIPTGSTSDGMDVKSVIVQREYGSLSQEPNPVITDYIRSKS